MKPILMKASRIAYGRGNDSALAWLGAAGGSALAQPSGGGTQTAARRLQAPLDGEPHAVDE